MREALVALGLAVGLGLLVGFQRERSGVGLAGFRTFPLIALAGALCAMVGREAGAPWLLPAGLVAITGLVLTGHVAGWQAGKSGVGVTTETAAVVMFLVGALAVAGFWTLSVVVGGTVAVLLHLKRPMHGLAERLSDDDVRTLMRIVLIGLVILPVLPDETYGPYDVLNPFRIWLMVVLIVGISVASYVLYRLVGARAGTFLGGFLGGLISSTATMASYARRAGEERSFAPAAAAVAMVASTVVFLRIFIEVGAVAPGVLVGIAKPLGAMAALNVGLSAIGVARISGRSAGAAPKRDDPTELRAALVFGALYGAILFVVAAAKNHFGDAGLYGVATLSGMTDVDAITLSVANLADAGRVDVGTAWRAILLATLANLTFKGGLAFALGGVSLLRPVGLLFGPSLAGGIAILALWP